MMRSGFRRRFRGLILLALPLALVACGKRSDGERNLDTLDNELVQSNSAAARDPALMSALHEQIMVDPTLAQQANNDAVRPPPPPHSGAVPPARVARAPGGSNATPGAAPPEHR